MCGSPLEPWPVALLRTWLLTVPPQSGSVQYHDPQGAHLVALRTVFTTGRRTLTVSPVPPLGPASAITSSSIHSTSSISTYFFEEHPLQLRPQDEKLSAKNRTAGMNAKVFIGSRMLRLFAESANRISPAPFLVSVWLNSWRAYCNATLKIRPWKALGLSPAGRLEAVHLRYGASKLRERRDYRPSSRGHRDDQKHVPESGLRSGKRLH